MVVPAVLTTATGAGTEDEEVSDDIREERKELGIDGDVEEAVVVSTLAAGDDDGGGSNGQYSA